MRVVNVSEEVLENVTSLNTMSTDNVSSVSNFTGDDEAVLYPIEWVIPVTAIYAVIFVSGLIGNVSTCVVIKRNMSLHTVTNYYLFSIAISDLLLLISGLPPEMYRLWSPATYVFGETLCVLQGFAAETSANATVLTITAFTVERYIAICHPFLSHTMSNLSRAIKFIITIWIISLCLAAPQAILFGVEYEFRNGVEYSRCTVVSKDFFQYSFLISTLIFFVLPMTIITFLYILIGIKLSKSRMIATAKRSSLSSNSDGISRTSRAATAQKRVIKMLVAVVVAFFICWAPFHAQRLLAVYLATASPEAQAAFLHIYTALMYISGVLYFLSTTVNPVLYHIMSNKFREAFKNTFYAWFGGKKMVRGRETTTTRTYSMLSRCPPSLKKYQRSISDGVANCQQLPLNPHDEDSDDKQISGNGKVDRFRPRMLSQTSQTTMLTTISKSISVDGGDRKKPEPRRHEDIGNRKYLDGFSKIFSLLHSPYEAKNSTADSANNTISNSSLQDLEEIEFSSSDLVRYMEEVNEDLI